MQNSSYTHILDLMGLPVYGEIVQTVKSILS